MATKTLFTVAVVVCALTAATGIPIFRMDDDARGPPPLDLPVMAVRKAMATNPTLRFRWNASEVMKKVEEAVTTVENKIEEVAKDVENVAVAVSGSIEDAAVEMVHKWNKDVQQWAAEAGKAGVDVEVCVEREEALSFDVADAIRTDAHECAAKPLAGLMAALDDVRATAPFAEAVVAEAKAKADECQKKGTLNTISMCLLAGMPRVQMDAAKVVAEATLRAGLATAKAVAVGPVAGLCAASATARHAAEAKTIVSDAVNCIKDKLNA